MINLQVHNPPIKVKIQVKEVMKGQGCGGATNDYEKLENKPQINSVTLEGNKSLEDLGIEKLTDYVIIQGIL